MAVLLGLTGNIACGKTTVGKLLVEQGVVKVIDADQTVHRLLRSGTPVYTQARAEFGHAILQEDGEIDRRALGRIVFADPAALKRLEGIIHPAVHEATEEELRGFPPDAVVVLDAVKLIESGSGARCRQRWLVNCPEQLQWQRLTSIRGYSSAEAWERIHAQAPVEPRLDQIEVVIDNGGTLAETRRQVEEAYRKFVQIRVL